MLTASFTRASFTPQAGDMLAVKQGVDTECLSAPCLLGDLALLGDELPQCRLRPYTHRAVGAVRVWELPLHDLDVLFAMHWSLKEKLLQLMRNVSGGGAAFEGGGGTHSAASHFVF